MLGTCLLAFPANAADERFAVKVSGQALEVGKAQTVQIKLTADSPWHMNMEYPTSMKLGDAAGIELGKTKFSKGDAKVLSEHKIVFEVPVKANRAGQFVADAKIKFAICKADSCSPASTKVKLRLSAKAAPAKPEPKAKPKAAEPRAKRPAKQTKKPARKANPKNAKSRPDAAPQNCGRFASAAPCPALPVYLLNAWVLAPVWGAGLIEQVFSHLQSAPGAP